MMLKCRKQQRGACVMFYIQPVINSNFCMVKIIFDFNKLFGGILLFICIVLVNFYSIALMVVILYVITIHSTSQKIILKKYSMIKLYLGQLFVWFLLKCFVCKLTY